MAPTLNQHTLLLSFKIGVFSTFSALTILGLNFWMPHLFPANTFLSDSFYEKRAHKNYKTKPNSDITVISINESLVSKLNYRSPFDRCLLANALETIFALNPAVVGIDLLFDQHTDIDKDDMLKKVLHKYQKRLVVAYHSSFDGQNNVSKEFMPGHFVPENSLANVSLPVSYDGVVRSALLREGGNTSFALALAQKFNLSNISAQSDEIIIDWAESSHDENLLFKNHPIEYFLAEKVKKTCALPNIAVPVIPPNFYQSHIENKIVIIGVSFADRHYTPMDFVKNDRPQVSGVEIHAHITQQLVDGRYIKKLPLLINGFIISMILFYGLIYRNNYSKNHINKYPMTLFWRFILNSPLIFLPIATLVVSVEFLALYYFNLTLHSGLILMALGIHFGHEIALFIGQKTMEKIDHGTS